MPIINSNTPAYRPQKPLEVDWDNWRGGFNNLLRATELKPNELAQADNITLTGAGVPTGRWGTVKYFEANATGTIRGFGLFATGASVSEILALTDEGYICKNTSTGCSRVNGASYVSGSKIYAEQLGGKTYIVSKTAPMTEYDGSTLKVYATLPKITGLLATNVSGVTGPSQYSWKIIALGANGGTTEGSEPITLPNLPFDLGNTRVRVTWNPATGGSITGYEIYRGTLGNERFLASVDNTSTSYLDTGEPTSNTLVVPIINTTGGVKARFIKKVGDRLAIVPEDDPTKLMISGRYPYNNDFSFINGGGYVYVDPKSGQEITGIDVQMGSDKIIVFKDDSSYQVTLSTATLGNYVLLDPIVQQLSSLVGCSSFDSIKTVENDVFYFGRKGLYVIGYEPNFLNIIRTNEVSLRIRPYLDTLNDTDYKNCCAMYVDNKYILSFPERKEIIVYDRERGAFLGIWKLPYGISKMIKFVDDSGTEKWVLGSNESNQVYNFEPSVNSDDGTTIAKTIRLKKEQFNSWALLKIIQLFYIQFRNITGSVSVNIILEDRKGTSYTAKTFNISGSEIAGTSGYGCDTYGSVAYGLTNATVSVSNEETLRWATLYKECRLLQVEIICDDPNSNFELLSVRITANSQGEGQLSSSLKV